MNDNQLNNSNNAQSTVIKNVPISDLVNNQNNVSIPNHESSDGIKNVPISDFVNNQNNNNSNPNIPGLVDPDAILDSITSQKNSHGVLYLICRFNMRAIFPTALFIVVLWCLMGPVSGEKNFYSTLIPVVIYVVLSIVLFIVAIWLECKDDSKKRRNFFIGIIYIAIMIVAVLGVAFFRNK